MATNIDCGYEVPPVHAFGLLMLVRQVDEQPLLCEWYTEEIVNFYCFKVMNQYLIAVQILNEYESQIDFKLKEVIAKELERIMEWEGVKVEITCTVAPREELELVMKDLEITRCKFAFLERKLRSQKKHQPAMEQLQRSVNSSLEKLGRMQQNTERIEEHN